MNGSLKFSLAGRLKSFKCAGHGIFIMLKYEHNAWVHTLMTVLVTALGLLLSLTSYEWCWIVLAIVAVWTAEAINTAFEFLCDVAAPTFHPMVERAKDVAAGGVLITSIGSAVVGVLILGPRLWEVFFT